MRKLFDAWKQIIRILESTVHVVGFFAPFELQMISTFSRRRQTETLGKIIEGERDERNQNTVDGSQRKLKKFLSCYCYKQSLEEEISVHLGLFEPCLWTLLVTRIQPN